MKIKDGKKIIYKNIIFFILKFISFPIVFLYLIVLCIRNLFYDYQILNIKKLPRPVISIGNVSVGGSGKTAVVLSLVEKFNNTCVLTRGYKSKITTEKLYPKEVTNYSTDLFGDEPCLISSYMKTGLVVIDPDRHRGGLYAQKKNSKIDLFILDDGYQHRKLHRDLDLLVFDLDTFVNSWVFNKYFTILSVLPFGKFREPLYSISRADYILVTKWKHIDTNLVKVALKHINKFNKNIVFLKSEISEITNNLGNKKTNGNVILFSGIGNPSVFEQDIARDFPDLKILKHIVFSDHYKYTKNDIQDLVKLAKENDAFLICTEKDFVKVKEFNMVDIVENFYFGRQTLKFDPTVLDRINALIE